MTSAIFFRLLDEISAFLQRQINTGFLKSLYSGEERISKIEEYHRRICATVDAFQVILVVPRSQVDKCSSAPSVTYSIVDPPADLTIPHCWWAIQSQPRISCSHCWWVGRLVCYVHYIWIGWELWVEFFNWLARNCKRSNNSMLYRQAELMKIPLATDWPA